MTLVKFAVGVAVAFGGLVALMYAAQRSLMYFPERLRTSPAAAGLPEAKELVLETADGEKVIVWHLPPRGDKPVVLYFHGNGGALRYRVDRFRALTADGMGLLALSYRGYGGSTGSPSEVGLIADAEAAYAFAAARYPAERIAVWGESLGSGVAVALASAHKIGRLVLEAPFSSAADVGAQVYWFLPVRLLSRIGYDNLANLKRIRAPVFIAHSRDDDIVPYAHGRKLFDAAAEPKTFLEMRGGHNDGFIFTQPEWVAALGDFLDRHAAAK
jgi:fermentation-respiration switch protein FrsA (DUF1100 family)